VKRLLRVLLRLLPTVFRHEFGPDVAEQIERDLEAALERGRGRALAFSLATAADLVWVAGVERLDPTWVGVGPHHMKRSRGDGMMRNWMRDLYVAFRSLRRTPGFTVVAVGTLGLAIGANAGIFAVVDKVLIDPLPFAASDRLVVIAASAPGSDFPEEFGVSAEFYLEYRTQTDLIEDAGTSNWFTGTLRVADRIERVPLSMPSPTLFTTLGVEPALGRLPIEEDESTVALISHFAWVDWFGGDPEVIGRAYSINGEMRTVVGVMDADFAFPNDQVLAWIPVPQRAEGIEPGRFGLNMVARLAPGVEMETLVERLATVAGRLPEKYGGSANYARLIEQHRPVVRSLKEDLLGGASTSLWVLFGSISVVLLIACANVTNLFLVRAERRQMDLSVRRAIGAGWSQLVRFQMAEAVIVAGLAGIAALLVARLGLPLLIAAAPPMVPRLGQASLSLSTYAFTLGTSMFAALVCGILPAIRGARTQPTGLRDGSRGSTRRRHWGRDALVVAQTSMAFVLLIGSGLLVRSFQELRAVDPGYDIEDVFTFQIAIENETRLTDGASFARFHLDFMERLAALPGVRSVGIVENVPLNEGVGGVRIVTEDDASEEDGGALLGRTFTAGDYFSTMGISLLRGRTFEEADHLSNDGYAIVSESAAELLWPGEDPIGRRLQWPALGTWETVVGVVEDVMQYSFRDEVQPLVYFPLVGQSPETYRLSSPAYVIKTSRAEDIAPEVRAIVREIAPTAPMYRVFTMQELAADSMIELSFTTLALGIASVLALLLGTVGLYGVLSYVVAERTREIGVRMALGAGAERVRRMVVVQGGRVVIVGVAIGLLASVAATRVLDSLLYGVGTVDVLTFSGVAATMVVIGLLASYVPARRASSVDPAESLRG
jgi:putative ABC transport system permease protein